jgi:hypothetical protein
MASKNFDQIHIQVYSEIINGKFNPCLPRSNQPEVLSNLVIEANTIKAATLPASEDPSEFVENTDFLSYGYKKDKDYKVEIKPAGNGKHEIIVHPLKVYDLNEIMDIPQYVSFKCNIYIEFMGDEFERVKTRANWMLDHGFDDKLIATYAMKHIQKAKMLFNEAKRTLRDVLKTENTGDIFIFFALNLFIIRTILYYQGMFQPFLTQPPDTEGNLFIELLNEFSLKKLCTSFPSRKSGFVDYLKKSLSENTGSTGGVPFEYPSESTEPVSDKKSQPVAQGKALFERIKVNGQINALVDIFLQMLEEIEVPEGMFIETSRENLKDFLVACFKDKNDKPFSPYTIGTLLKPYRTDKHIKKESPRKIDLSKRMKKK